MQLKIAFSGSLTLNSPLSFFSSSFRRLIYSARSRPFSPSLLHFYSNSVYLFQFPSPCVLSITIAFFHYQIELSFKHFPSNFISIPIIRNKTPLDSNKSIHGDKPSFVRCTETAVSIITHRTQFECFTKCSTFHT